MKILRQEKWIRQGALPEMLPFARYVMPDDLANAYVRALQSRVDFSVSSVNSEERRYAGQDLDGKSLLVVRYQGIGDTLIVTALFRYLRHLYRGATIHAYSLTFDRTSRYGVAGGLAWLGNRDLSISRALPLPVPLDALRQYDYHVLLDGMMEMNTEPDQRNAYDDMFSYVGLTNVPRQFKRPWLYEHPIDRGWVEENSYDLSRPHIVYVVHASSPLRTYPWNYSRFVIESLRATFPDTDVLVVTEKNVSGLRPDEHIRVIRFDNWREGIPLIATADCVVTPDTGFGHVAACFPSVPVVSLWSAFSFESRAKYYINHRPLSVSKEMCPHAPCWEHGRDIDAALRRCDDCKLGRVQGKACAGFLGIKPEMVIGAVEEEVRKIRRQT